MLGEEALVIWLKCGKLELRGNRFQINKNGLLIFTYYLQSKPKNVLLEVLVIFLKEQNR